MFENLRIIEKITRTYFGGFMKKTSLIFVLSLSAILTLAACQNTDVGSVSDSGASSAQESVSSSSSSSESSSSESSSSAESSSSSSDTSSSAESSSFSSGSDVNLDVWTLTGAIHSFLVGSTVDIAKYLVVTPADATWTFALSDTTSVTAEGTVLTAVFPGAFVLTLTSGGKDTSIDGLVISQELSDIRDFDSENGLGSCTNYLASFYKTGSLIGQAYHNDSFVYRKAVDGSFPNDGYLVSMNDETCYAFTADENNVPTIGSVVENGLQFNKFGDAFPFAITDYVDLSIVVDGKETTTVAIVNRPVAIPACTQFAMGIDSTSLMAPDEMRVTYSADDVTVLFDFYAEGADTGYSLLLSHFQDVSASTFPELASIWDWMVNN
jgi:hypothetical protein